MSRHKPSRDERQARRAARQTILVLANLHTLGRYRRMPYRAALACVSRGVDPRPNAYGMRNLHRAVAVVRQNKLVSDELLKLAGFRPAVAVGAAQ